jgi:hypothetical protein
MWPCGVLDRHSGCVSRVQLDVAAVGLHAATAKVSYLSFDLGPDAKVALVAIAGPQDGVGRGVLGLFDAQSGALIRILYENDHGRSDLDKPVAGEVAFSPDGSHAAAVVYDWAATRANISLVVYNTGDGAVVHTLENGLADFDCSMELDFSPDGQKLQCGNTVYDLTTYELSSLVRGNMVLPMYADFASSRPQAPDGTKISVRDLPSLTEIFDARATLSFAPDSVGLLEVWRAHPENRGQRWWTPSVFRYLSGVGVWDGKTQSLLRRFYANERYRAQAWARDGSHFGFVSDDLNLTVFVR